MHSVRTSLVVLAALGCGSVDSARPDGRPAAVVTLTAAGGANVPAGSSIELALAATPAKTIALTTDTGTLRTSGAAESQRVTVVADADGRAAVQLRVPLAASPGVKIALTADAELAGDVQLTITAPSLVAAGDFRLARGFRVEVVGTSVDLVGREVRMAIPPRNSKFGPGTYIVGGGRDAADWPIVIRFPPGGAPVPLSTPSDAFPSGPRHDVSQLAFGTDTQFSDLLFACSASGNDGDGIFTLDASGTWRPLGAFANCNGLAFDRDKLLGDPMFGDATHVPMYLNLGAQKTRRVQTAETSVEIDDQLLYGDAGWLWYMHRATAFPAGAYLVYSLALVKPDGKLWYLPTAKPFEPQRLLDLLDSPTAAAFTDPESTFGDLLFLASRETGIVSGIRPDRSTFKLLDGLGRTPDLLVGANGELLTFDTVRGQLLRITREP